MLLGLTLIAVVVLLRWTRWWCILRLLIVLIPSLFVVVAICFTVVLRHVVVECPRMCYTFDAMFVTQSTMIFRGVTELTDTIKVVSCLARPGQCDLEPKMIGTSTSRFSNQMKGM